MYYYALIDSTNNVCYEVIESETPITDDPYCVELDLYDTSYILRKKYVDGEWYDTEPYEAQNMDAKYIGVNNVWLDDKIVAMDDAIANHTHDGYASSDDLALLEDVVDTKANATHTHSEYASSSHSHDNYATITSLDTLESEVNGKANANHTHTEYASISHTHNEYAATNHAHSNYAESTHNHDTDYADINHNHNSAYASAGHDHDEDYATIDHTHTNYATTTALNEVSSVVSGKANASHTHNDIYYTETEIDTKLSGKANSTHNHNDAYDTKGSATNALASANAYTDSKIDALVGDGASTTLDTIGEISSAIEDNQDAIDLLNSAIGNKANSSDLTSHTSNTTVHVTSTDKNNWNIAKTHADSAHAPSNAEKNQNAFSNIAVGNATISADTPTDTLTLVAGSNVTLTPNATGDSVTIASTNTIYTHPTSAGNKHIPAGGSSGQILRWSADGTAVWGADNNTTYSNATQSASGLMSNTDKTKLDGIETGANKYVLPSAGSSLGGVKTGGDVTISSGVITVNDDSHNHVISNIDGLQSALDGKAASGHTHNSAYISKNLQMTSDTGDISISWSGKDVVAQFKALASGMYTAYSPIGNTNNPNSGEAFRFMCHKTGSVNYGWIMAYGGKGSVYTGYIDNGNWQGWKALWEYAPAPLWSGGANGGYYMTATHTITPTKKLSECRNGWALLWSDYDVGGQANNTDFYVSYIYKRAYTGQVWGGGEWYCDIPSYSAGTATDSEQRVIKLLQIYDAKIVGTANNAVAPRSDVVLRAVYEF